MYDNHETTFATSNDIRTEWERDRLESLKTWKDSHPQHRADLLANWTPPPTHSFLPEPEELRRHKNRRTQNATAANTHPRNPSRPPE